MGRGLVGRGVVVGFSGVPLAHQGSGVEAPDIGGVAAIGHKRAPGLWAGRYSQSVVLYRCWI